MLSDKIVKEARAETELSAVLRAYASALTDYQRAELDRHGRRTIDVLNDAALAVKDAELARGVERSRTLGVLAATRLLNPLARAVDERGAIQAYAALREGTLV